MSKIKGIDLYKAILYDGEKYIDKTYTDGVRTYDIKATEGGGLSIYESSVSIFYYSTPIKVNKFFRAELTEVLCPMPWHECIKRWAENYGEYMIKIVTHNEERFYNNNSFLLSDTGIAIENDDILKGDWYLIEKETH